MRSWEPQEIKNNLKNILCWALLEVFSRFSVCVNQHYLLKSFLDAGGIVISCWCNHPSEFCNELLRDKVTLPSLWYAHFISCLAPQERGGHNVRTNIINWAFCPSHTQPLFNRFSQSRQYKQEIKRDNSVSHSATHWISFEVRESDVINWQMLTTIKTLITTPEPSWKFDDDARQHLQKCFSSPGSCGWNSSLINQLQIMLVSAWPISFSWVGILKKIYIVPNFLICTLR